MGKKSTLRCTLIDMPVTIHHHFDPPHEERMIGFWRSLVGESRVHDCRRLVNLHLFHLTIVVDLGYYSRHQQFVIWVRQSFEFTTTLISGETRTRDCGRKVLFHAMTHEVAYCEERT